MSPSPSRRSRRLVPRDLLPGAAAFVALLLGAACGGKPPRTARIAVAVPLTGALAADGEGIVRAVRMAAAEAKPLEFPPLALDVAAFDDKASPEEAAAVARRVAGDREVVAVIGHLTSGCSLAASRIYAEAGLPMITPSATNPELTLQQTRTDWPWPKVVFRLPPSDDIQGAFAADFAYDRLGLRTFSVIHDGTPYGQGLAEEFRKQFSAKGGQVVSFEAIAKGASDYRAAVEWSCRFKPAGLFFGGDYTEAGIVFRQARELGLAAAFMAGDGSKAPEIFKTAGAAVNGAYFTVGGVPVELTADFAERYKARYPEAKAGPRTFDHFAYEAASLLIEALRASGSQRTAQGRPKPLLECIREGRYESMMGTIVFDHKGDTTKRLITVTRADAAAKEFRPVDPLQ